MKASELLRVIKLISTVGANVKDSQAARAYAHSLLGGGRTLQLRPGGEHVTAAQLAIEQALERHGKEAVIGFGVTKATEVGKGAAKGLGIASATGPIRGGFRSRIDYQSWRPHISNPKLPMQAGGADPPTEFIATKGLDPYTDLANTFGAAFTDITPQKARIFDYYTFTEMDVNERMQLAEGLQGLLRAIISGKPVTTPLASLSHKYGKPFNIYMDVPVTERIRKRVDKLTEMAERDLQEQPWQPR